MKDVVLNACKQLSLRGTGLNKDKVEAAYSHEARNKANLQNDSKGHSQEPSLQTPYLGNDQGQNRASVSTQPENQLVFVNEDYTNTESSQALLPAIASL